MSAVAQDVSKVERVLFATEVVGRDQDLLDCVTLHDEQDIFDPNRTDMGRRLCAGHLA